MTWWVQLISCFVAAASFSVLLHQPRKSILVSSLIAMAGYGVFLLLNQDTTAYFLATLLIGVLCEVFARILKRTATSLVTGAIVPLVPGVGLYNTMRHVVEGSYREAVTVGVKTMLGLCGIALAINASSLIISALRPRKGKKPC